MRALAYSVYNISLEVVGHGHNNFILSMLEDMYTPYLGEMTQDAKKLFGVDIIIEYLATILNKYIDNNNRFHEGKYFHEVYSKNVDTWGFIMAYLDIIDFNNQYLRRSDLSIAVTKIISEYCFSTTYATTPIPIHKLVADIKRLNKIV